MENGTFDLNKKILSDIIVHSKYARHLPEKNRREDWKELVERNQDMHIRKYPELENEIKQVEFFIRVDYTSVLEHGSALGSSFLNTFSQKIDARVNSASILVSNLFFADSI